MTTRNHSKTLPNRPKSTLTCYKAKRWNGFLTDIHQESTTFGEVVKSGILVKDMNEIDYKKHAQRSFNAIHNVERKKPDPNKMVFRQKRKSTTRSINDQPKNPFQYETRLANYNNWPKRPGTARRILTPVRLGDYPDMERPKDVIALFGKPVSEPSLL